jgi:hypothetical protein
MFGLLGRANSVMVAIEAHGNLRMIPVSRESA